MKCIPKKYLLEAILIGVCLATMSVYPTNSLVLPNSEIQKETKNFDWLSYYLDKFNKERGFSGAILVAHKGEVVFEQVIGWQDVEKGIKNKMDTRFNLGSGNKMFTSVAIAQLVEAGKLKYSDPVLKHLLAYPDQDFASQATIHDLLTHSSGLGDYWNDEYEKHWHKLTRLEERLPFVLKDPIQFTPGTQFAYSNSGFILLGLIIEQVSGMNSFEYIRKNIYEPCGMHNTDTYKNNQTVADLAVAYQGLGKQWYEARHGLMGTSAGGGYATIHDIWKFDQALRNHELLSPAYTALIRSDKTPRDEATSWDYGYGFIVNEDNGSPRIGHGGRGPGLSFEYYFYPDNDYTLIMFSNAESGSSDALFNKLSDFISDPDKHEIIIPDEVKKNTQQEPFQVKLVEHPDRKNYVKVLEPSPASNLATYWPVLSSLAKALNQGDMDAFNQDFTSKDVVTLASNESMFNFMVKQVIPVRGKIKEFHSMGPLVEIPDSDFPIQVGTFHLEDGYPGSISISLNEKGKIDHLSLFVHPQICPEGPRKDCPKVSLRLKKE